MSDKSVIIVMSEDEARLFLTVCFDRVLRSAGTMLARYRDEVLAKEGEESTLATDAIDITLSDIENMQPDLESVRNKVVNSLFKQVR